MPVRAPPDRQLDSPHASIRMDVRLDAETRQKVDDLAGHFHQLRATVLRHIIQWGLDQGAMAARDQGHAQGPVRYLHLYMDSGAGVHLAPWLRQMVRHIPITAFPGNWREGTISGAVP